MNGCLHNNREYVSQFRLIAHTLAACVGFIDQNGQTEILVGYMINAYTLITQWKRGALLLCLSKMGLSQAFWYPWSSFK